MCRTAAVDSIDGWWGSQEGAAAIACGRANHPSILRALSLHRSPPTHLGGQPPHRPHPTHLRGQSVQGEDGEEVLQLPVQVAHQREPMPLGDRHLVIIVGRLVGVSVELEVVAGLVGYLGLPPAASAPRRRACTSAPAAPARTVHCDYEIGSVLRYARLIWDAWVCVSVRVCVYLDVEGLPALEMVQEGHHLLIAQSMDQSVDQ